MDMQMSQYLQEQHRDCRRGIDETKNPLVVGAVGRNTEFLRKPKVSTITTSLYRLVSVWCLTLHEERTWSQPCTAAPIEQVTTVNHSAFGCFPPHCAGQRGQLRRVPG